MKVLKKKKERYMVRLSRSLGTFSVSFSFLVTLTVLEISAKNYFNALFIKIGPKLAHPVSRLFSKVKGGSATQNNRTTYNRNDLHFTVVLGKKFYLKNCIQGDQK